jgi:hypothetical protein
MSTQYRNNHYVPVWYQKRFLLPGSPSNELFYMDLRPGSFKDGRGVVHRRRAVKRTGLRRCFAETDLYRTHFGGQQSTELEKAFFGRIDAKGRLAVEYFGGFQHPSADRERFNDLLAYMTVQKLRTPKGLSWLAEEGRTTDRDRTLALLLQLQQVYGAIWAECVWLIADATGSTIKFIVSDHPVTVYNRSCGPNSSWCRRFKDPSIAFHATQTIFPLSSDRVLLLTNLSWVRNPYQHERGTRPNPNPWRSAMFNFTEIQTRRQLAELEVQQINFIIKSRAFRYIAAADEAWLYPERYVSAADWSDFGNGYLLMPDPRCLALGGTILIGRRDGGATSFDAYGRRPWEGDFEDRQLERVERRTFYRFQGEFATLYGPYRRGRGYELGGDAPERDSDKMHEFHQSYWRHKKQRG